MVLLPGHITAPDAPFSRSPILKFFASAIDLLSIGLRLNINQPGRTGLNQSICKRGHLPRPDPLETNSSRAQQFPKPTTNLID